LGDPSIHPVQAVVNTVSSSRGASWSNTRKNRRENLRAKGASLQESIIPPTHSDKVELPLEIQPAIRKMLKENKMNGEVVKEVYVNKGRQTNSRQKAGSQEVRFIAYSEKENRQRFTGRRILMIKEKGNQLLGSRLYLSH